MSFSNLQTEKQSPSKQYLPINPFIGSLQQFIISRDIVMTAFSSQFLIFFQSKVYHCLNTKFLCYLTFNLDLAFLCKVQSLILKRMSQPWRLPGHIYSQYMNSSSGILQIDRLASRQMDIYIDRYLDRQVYRLGFRWSR